MAKSFTNQFVPTIDKGVDVPIDRAPRGKETLQRINWPFENMDVGDSFLLPSWCNPARAHKAIAALRKRGSISSNLSVICRAEGDTNRVWLVERD